MKPRSIKINDLMVGSTYQHWKNKRFVVEVVDRFETSRGAHLILKHQWVDELHVCLEKVYETSRWIEIGRTVA